MPRHPPNALETLDRSHLQRPTPDAMLFAADLRPDLRQDDQTRLGGTSRTPFGFGMTTSVTRQQTVSRSGTAQHLQSALTQFHRASETCIPSTSTPELDQHALHHVQKTTPAPVACTIEPGEPPSVDAGSLCFHTRSICLLPGPSLVRAASRQEWWAREDLNFRPHAYQARALTN
jgi:hypothetical protein